MKRAFILGKISGLDGDRPNGGHRTGNGLGRTPGRLTSVAEGASFPLREFTGILTGSLIGGAFWLVVLTLALTT